MAAGKHNITIEQGANFLLTGTWVDQNAAAVNLTGGTIASKVRLTFDATSELIAFSCSITDAVNGKFTLTLTSVQTAALNFDRAVYDVEIILGSTTYRVMQGNVVLSKEATK